MSANNSTGDGASGTREAHPSAGPSCLEPRWNRPLVNDWEDARRTVAAKARKPGSSAIKGTGGYGTRLARGFGLIQGWDRD